MDGYTFAVLAFMALAVVWVLVHWAFDSPLDSMLASRSNLKRSSLSGRRVR